MNLSELVHEVWKDDRMKALGIRKDETRIIMRVVVDKMREGLLDCGKLKIENLFTLEIKKVSGRRIANPITSEHMMIDNYHRITVTPSKIVKDGLKEYKED